MALFDDYNSVGITSIIDRNANEEDIKQYEGLLKADELSLRIGISRGVGTSGPLEDIEEEIRGVAEHPLRQGGPMLRIIGIKMFLDGGMLTG